MTISYCGIQSTSECFGYKSKSKCYWGSLPITRRPCGVTNFLSKITSLWTECQQLGNAETLCFLHDGLIEIPIYSAIGHLFVLQTAARFMIMYLDRTKWESDPPKWANRFRKFFTVSWHLLIGDHQRSSATPRVSPISDWAHDYHNGANSQLEHGISLDYNSDVVSFCCWGSENSKYVPLSIFSGSYNSDL